MAGSISIRTRLVRDSVTTVLMLGLGVLVATQVGTRMGVRSAADSLMNQTLLAVEARLDGYFSAARQEIDVVVEQASAGAFDLQPGSTVASGADLRDHRVRLLRPIVGASRQISSIILVETTGAEQMLLESDGRWRTRVISPERPGEAEWTEWADGSGPRTWLEPTTYDPATRPWYRGALAAGEGRLHWTEPYTFFTTGEPGITVSTVFAEAGGVRRILAVDIPLEDISAFTRGIRVTRRGVAAVLTADGRLVGLPSLAEFEDASARSGAYLARPDALGLALVDDALAARSRTRADADHPMRFVSGGEAWWAWARPYALSPERELRAVVLAPEAELLGAFRLLPRVIGGLMALALAVGVWRAFAVAGRFSKPIEALAAQAGRIASGKLEPGPSVESPIAEVQRLAEAQEQMREGVVARIRLAKVDRDLQIARDIQRGLLPERPPSAPGFEIAGWTRPADETGGDYYDWLTLPDGRTLLTIADATGHGIGPALIVAACRAYTRATAREPEPALGDIVSRVNALLGDDVATGRFVTAAFGLVDTVSGTVSVVSAGQGPIFFYRASEGTVDALPADVPPLGILPDLECPNPSVFEMGAGDALVVATDGFFECVGPDGEQLGVPRLSEFIRNNAALEPPALIRALHDAVRAHTKDRPQGDDLTIVVVRRAPHCPTPSAS